MLDHKLVEFAGTIPAQMNLRNGTTKYILKQAMRGILPDAIIDRRKQGFAVPLGFWFRGKGSELMRNLLLDESSRRRGIFNPRYLERLIQRHESGHDLDLQIWTLMSFELWARLFLDRGAKGCASEAA